MHIYTHTRIHIHPSVISADLDELHTQEGLLQAASIQAYEPKVGDSHSAGADAGAGTGTETNASMRDLLKSLGSTTGAGELQDLHVAISMKHPHRHGGGSSSSSSSSSGARSVGADAKQQHAFTWAGHPNWHLLQSQVRDELHIHEHLQEQTCYYAGRARSAHSDISNITYGTPQGSLIGCGGCCTTMPHFTSQYKQVIMPDISLLTLGHVPLSSQTATQITQGSVFSR